MRHLRSAVVLIFVFALTWALHAQAISMAGARGDVARLELAANYNYFHANAPPGQCGCFSLNGGSGTVVYNITSAWAGVADLAVGHATNVDHSLQNITIFNYLFRPTLYVSQPYALDSLRPDSFRGSERGCELPIHNQSQFFWATRWWRSQHAPEASFRTDSR